MLHWDETYAHTAAKVIIGEIKFCMYLRAAINISAHMKWWKPTRLHSFCLRLETTGSYSKSLAMSKKKDGIAYDREFGNVVLIKHDSHETDQANDERGQNMT